MFERANEAEAGDIGRGGGQVVEEIGDAAVNVGEAQQNDSYARLRRLLLGLWFGLYAFIGSQMTWRLSPFINDPSLPFEFIRPTRDNFYVDALRAFVEATGLQVSLIDTNVALVAAGCLIPLIALTFAIGMVTDRRHRQTPRVTSAPQTEPQTKVAL